MNTKVAQLLKDAKQTQVSFELLPPLKGGNIESLYNTLKPLMEFKPPYINITYHREETVYKQHASGLLERKVVRKRPGTVAIAAALRYKLGIEVVPHIICGGFSVEETENALIDLHFLGIHNLLVVRGDADKDSKIFIPEKNGHAYALELVKQIQKLNKGLYLDDELQNQTPTNFSVGVAGYPEKHTESPNIISDIKYLKQKIEAGAEYVVSQMFFDNKHFFSYVQKCQENGIHVPIVPGIKPISTFNHLSILPKTFHVDIPEELENAVRKCKNNEEVRQVGIEWAVMQSKELISKNVPVIHYYTMGKSDNIYKICKSVF